MPLFVDSATNIFRTFVADDRKHALSSRKSTEMGELDKNKTNQNLYDDDVIIRLSSNQSFT